MVEILPKMVMVNMAVRSKESTLSQTPRLFLFVGHRERAAQWPKGRLGQWEPWPWSFSPVVCGICEIFSVCACVKMYINIYTIVLYPIVIWTSLMWVCLNMGDPRFYSNSNRACYPGIHGIPLGLPWDPGRGPAHMASVGFLRLGIASLFPKKSKWIVQSRVLHEKPTYTYIYSTQFCG